MSYCIRNGGIALYFCFIFNISSYRRWNAATSELTRSLALTPPESQMSDALLLRGTVWGYLVWWNMAVLRVTKDNINTVWLIRLFLVRELKGVFDVLTNCEWGMFNCFKRYSVFGNSMLLFAVEMWIKTGPENVVFLIRNCKFETLKSLFKVLILVYSFNTACLSKLSRFLYILFAHTN